MRSLLPPTDKVPTPANIVTVHDNSQISFQFLFRGNVYPLHYKPGTERQGRVANTPA